MSDNPFDDWGDPGDDFSLPHERPAEPPPAEAAAPEPGPDENEITNGEVAAVLGLALEGATARQTRSQDALADAFHRFSEYEEEPAVIADELVREIGIEAATPFLLRWRAHDWEHAPGAPTPETADDWLAGVERRMAIRQAAQQAADAQATAESQQKHEAEVNVAFNEGIKQERRRHAANSRRMSVKPDAALLEVVAHLSANDEPATVEEARDLGGQRYLQAVALRRAMGDADIKATFPDDPLRLNYLPSDEDREERAMAFTADDERLAEFYRSKDSILEGVEVTPTLTQQLLNDLDPTEQERAVRANDFWNA